jgi:hypothetical protein
MFFCVSRARQVFKIIKKDVELFQHGNYKTGKSQCVYSFLLAKVYAILNSSFYVSNSM